MKRIERYILIETLKPCAVVLLVLAGLFASFTSARLLAAGLSESLGAGGLALQISLKVLIALEVLLPVSLYVGIIMGLGRLHKDQEITAMTASGISRWRLIKAVLALALPVALCSGLISSFARPWAYAQTYLLDLQAEADLNTERFQAGRFYGNDRNGSVLYLAGKDPVNGNMRDIFYYVKKDRQHYLVKAQQARRLASESETPRLELTHGRIYQLDDNARRNDIAHFQRLVYLPESNNDFGYKRKAASIWQLAVSDSPRDLAELQWRQSRPLAALVLALLAVPLSEVGPRQGGNSGKSVLAALLFATYYNLTGLARTLVEQGKVASIPGLWWVYLLMMLVTLLLLFPDFWRRWARRL
ncbi:MAG: LPS export ABC transporter permease LptF [Methylococcales bacterium]|nr:LPS export ABC transporter permease LptF [Methylococcales bacterium]